MDNDTTGVLDDGGLKLLPKAGALVAALPNLNTGALVSSLLVVLTATSGLFSDTLQTYWQNVR